MHSSTIFTIFAMALTASAAPSAWGGSGSGSGSSSPTCSTSAANCCCEGFDQQTVGGILSTIGLQCTSIVGSSCTSGNAACCQSQSDGLVNVNVCQIAL